MKTRKHIYTWLAGAFLITGATLWSGCTNNELSDSITPDNTATTTQAGSLSFQLKGAGAKTRAVQDAKDDETGVKTMYAAFFIKNEDEAEVNYKLHRIFYADESNSTWGDNTKMTSTEEDDGTKKFTITTDNMKNTLTYTGTYIVCFIANPEAAIITQLKTYQDSPEATRTVLGTFEDDLLAKEVAYDAATTSGRGFTMMNKSTLEVTESPKSNEVKLTRLAARFDFINSSPTDATITSVKFNNLPKQADVVQKSVNTPDGYFYGSSDAALTKTWPTGSPTAPASMTVYTYENLNTNVTGNTRYSSIDVVYTLKAGGGSKTLRIDLKEKDSPLAIMRNHLYKINLNCLAGTYSMEVQDWIGGETVTIPNDKLAITYTATDLGKVGDYVYNNKGTLAFSDGGLRKMYLDGSLEWTTRPAPVTDKGTCVGILFSNQTSANDQAAGFKRGYVIALKNAGPATFWNTVAAAYSTVGKYSTFQDVIKDLDGYTYCKNTTKADNTFIKAAMDYNAALPSGTSGWYLPTTGQYAVFVRNLLGFEGLTSATGSIGKNQARQTSTFTVTNCGTKLNDLIKQLPQDTADSFVLTKDYWFPTCVQSPDYAGRVYFGGDWLKVNFDVGYSEPYTLAVVRSVFAF